VNELHAPKDRLQSLRRRLLLIVCLLQSLGIGYGAFLPSANAQSPDPPRRVNAPYFGDGFDWGRTSIIWFGQNKQGDPPTRNYADVRVGYTADALEIQVTVADYYLWYDEYADSSSDLTQYDAVAIYLDTDLDRAAAPQSDDYWFLTGARHWQGMSNYKRQARGNGSGWDTGWMPSNAWTAYSDMSWSCNPGPNSNECGIDFGWRSIFTIPWQTLGLSSRPADGTVWSLGVRLYDRDDAPPDGYVPPEHWPENFSPDAPSTWGELAFNPPGYEPQPAVAEGTTTIRRATETDTSVVQDAWVGGGAWCSGGHEGGADTNHSGFSPDGSIKERELFVGSEVAVTHLPCFSKSFLRFFLDDLPPNKTIISATLTLHHWGNSGDPNAANDEDRPHNSYVWLYSISDAWTETDITWNNAPLAQENLDVTRITPLSSHPGWPGIPYTWDATKAVATAYAAGQPVSLAIYDSAAQRNTSKYFTSSETGDWDAAGRPTLTVVWGQPQAVVNKQVWPVSVTNGDIITYTITWLGTSQPSTMTDTLPNGLSAPGPISASSGDASYDPVTQQVVWMGIPAAGQAVTITFPITVQIDGPLALRNTATLTVNTTDTSSDTALVIVDGHSVYLPLVVKP
jgi:hypothetical protein